MTFLEFEVSVVTPVLVCPPRDFEAGNALLEACEVYTEALVIPARESLDMTEGVPLGLA